MQLSGQLFADLVGEEAIALAASAVTDERRQSPRANLGRRARIYPLIETSSDHGQPVLVRDISVHGIGMLIGEQLTPGDEFIIHLPTALASSLEEPVQIQCAVRRCQAGGSGQTQFLVGSTFELVLNRPIDYAVEFPKDTVGDPQQKAPDESWDTLSASPVEGRFDEQLATAMANRPQRRSIAEWLDNHRMTRWIGHRLQPWLAPLHDLMRRLGIRNRLGQKSVGEIASGEQTEQASDELSKEAVAEAAIPFRERRMMTALDSASQYATNPEGLLESPASTYISAASSARRSSLFVHEVPNTSSETNAVATAEQIDAVVEPVAIAPNVTTPSSPPVIPAFELPAVLPAEIPPPVQTIAVASVDPATPATTLDTPIPLPLQPVLSAPPEDKSKQHHGAAWRGRHRLGWNEITRNRPRLGR